MPARRVKSLYPKSGYGHRDHRSKRGRSKAGRAPYNKSRRFYKEKRKDWETRVEIKRILNNI